MAIIKSILDTDLYKLTMQNAILAYPRGRGTMVKYGFNNRRKEGKFNEDFAVALREEIDAMASLALQPAEAEFLRDRVSFLGPSYIEYFRNYRYNPDEVVFKVENGELDLQIVGPWERAILWEVPLMALISELHFTHCEKGWTMKGQLAKAQAKRQLLDGIPYSEFGTRRRRNYATQDIVVAALKGNPSFRGTSNVHFAMKYNLRPIGTQAHEWYMAISVLESLRHANYYGMKIWSDIYQGRLGIALPDTFGTDAFFRDFNHYFARLFDGVRHDSGDPFVFGEKAIGAYEKLGIDPKTRTIVFSDSLTCELARQIYATFCARIGVAFGIGTHFTNDYENSPALNIVIKMIECMGVPVVKLSDEPGKQIGDPDALRVANWTFRGIPLDKVA